MIATCRDQIRTVGAERTVPDPSLMAVQRGFEREGSRVAVRGDGQVIAGHDVVRGGGVDGPNAGGVVGGARSQVADVGGEENACDVGGVGEKLANGEDGSGICALNHAPDVDVALEWVG